MLRYRDAEVALRKESVDRNVVPLLVVVWSSVSLSARRAWIEIEYTLYCPPFGESLSARRAWIEI